MGTMFVKNSVGEDELIEKPSSPGRAAASASKPMVLATEDKAALDQINTNLDLIGNYVDGLEALGTTHNTKLDTVATKLDTVNANLDSIETYVDGLESIGTTTNTRLDTVNANLDSIEAYVDGLETLGTATNTKLDTVNSNLDSIETYVDGLETLGTATNTKLDTVATKLDTVNSNLDTIEGYVDGLETLGTATNTKLDTVNANLDSIETYVDGLETLITSTNTKADTQITALQLLDDVVVTDDSAFTPATTKVSMAGYTFDDVTPDTVNEGDAGAARMSANRNQYVQIRDNAGNERGLNIDASGQIAVTLAASQTLATVTTVAAVTAITNALPAGTNAIGKLAPNSGVDIGDVDVTSVVPGVGATNLGKAEDAAHASGDTGVMALAVRSDTASAKAGTNGDYSPLLTDATGYLHVKDANSLAAGQAVRASSSPVALATEDVAILDAIKTAAEDTSAVSVTGNVGYAPTNAEYETVAASQTAQTLNNTGVGATGDYISHVIIVPATTSPGNVILLDNAISITLFTGGTSSVSGLWPIIVPLNMISVSGPWKITTGANVSVIAVGNFT